jgi:hypothetical protein
VWPSKESNVPTSNVLPVGKIACLAILVASAVTEAARPPTLVIHVVDYAFVPGSDLAQAQHEVERMFGSIGVKTIWREEHRLSASPADADDVTVVILSKSMSQRMHATEHVAECVLGRAAPQARRAWVYFDVIEAAEHFDVGAGRILAQVIAHEVGHVVANLAHSDRGTMRAVLDIQPGTFQGFTNADGKQIRTSLGGASEPGRASELLRRNQPPSFHCE